MNRQHYLIHKNKHMKKSTLQQNHVDTYQKVSDFVIKSLESGDIIWKKQWHSLGLPKNICSGHVYRGWNMFLLIYITMHYQYITPYFLTFKQAAEKGGYIKKGEKGTSIIYWAT